MAFNVLVNLDLGNNQILNVVMQALASDPTPVAGKFYYNTSDNVPKWSDGVVWYAFGGDGGDADTLEGQNGAYYLSRTNHTGTQAASTISDLATTVKAYTLDEFADPVADINMNGFKITGAADPTSAQDLVTKAYADALKNGLDIKASVRAATTANITLTGAQTIDGVSVIAGDRVLVKNQSTTSANGIYVAAAGSWSRATDADASAEVTAGLYTFVTEGTVNGDSGWVLTTDDPITLGSTSLTFVQFTGTGQITAGTGIVKSGNTISQDTANGYGSKVYSSTIGDGSSTAIVVTHNLGTRKILSSLFTTASPYDEVIATVEHTSTTTATIRFTVAPASAEYTIVLIGVAD